MPARVEKQIEEGKQRKETTNKLCRIVNMSGTITRKQEAKRRFVETTTQKELNTARPV